MNPTVIRPSLRRAKFSLVLCALFLAVVVWFWRMVVPEAHWVILLAGILPFFAPLLSWADTKRTSLTVDGTVVKYKHGIVSETVRAMDLARLQNIFVERTLSQRLWGVGTLVLETASEQGRIAIADIDNPQKTADWLLKISKEGTGV
ncbi:MAG: PH domain-containing protein [Acidobacteria bacterium]|nr:PH domain-containing protein [Acidobacteriota bacterium]